MEKTIREPTMSHTRVDESSTDLDANNQGHGQVSAQNEPVAEQYLPPLSVSQELAKSSHSPSLSLEQKEGGAKRVMTPSPVRGGSHPSGRVSEPKRSSRTGSIVTSSPSRAPHCGALPPHYNLDHSMVAVETPNRPVENKAITDYILSEPLPKQNFHVIRKAIEVTKEGNRTKIFKENPPGSFLSELETVCAAFYRFIAPDHIPETRAVYQEKDGGAVYCGVSSDEIPGFRPVSLDPVKEEDLNVAHLAEHNFSVLDDFDDELRLFEKNNAKRIEDLKKRLKECDESEKALADSEEGLQAKLQELYVVGADSSEIDAVSKQFILNSENKNGIFKERCAIIKELSAPYEKLKEHNVSKIEFERYRIVKGLAIGLTTSYIFVEDDLHQNNISKDGQRIDFDMSIWPILYEFKRSAVLDLDLAFRSPAKNMTDVTERDIRHFPNIKDMAPYYWPTNSANMLVDAARAVALKSSSNPYSAQANSVYQKLEKNPVFVYHKFATMLKYVLTNADMYRHIALLHMRKECHLPSKPSLIDVLAHFQAMRIQGFKDRLANMPEFTAFMKQHGDGVFARIMKQFTTQNADFVREIDNLKKEIEQLNDHSDSLSEVNDNLLARSTDNLEETVKTSQFQLPPMNDNYSVNLSESTTIQLKQAREERRLNFEMLNKNESDLKKVAHDINQKEVKCAIYARQKIDTVYVETMYRSICGRLTDAPIQAAPNLSRSGILSDPPVSSLSRANSLSGQAVAAVTVAATAITVATTTAPTVVKTPVTVAPSTSILAPLSSSRFSFNFGLSLIPAPQLVPPVKPKPNDYLAVKNLITKALAQYLNPGILGLAGLFRNKGALADQIQNFCNGVKDATDANANIEMIEKALKDPTDVEANKAAITQVKARLIASKAVVKSGALFDKLSEVLSDEIWAINEAKQENLSTSRTLSPHGS
jgi:hypothetical protein